MTKASAATKGFKTNKEIRREAAAKIAEGSDISAVATIFMLSAAALVTLTEALIYYTAKVLGDLGYHPFKIDYYHDHGSPAVLILILVRLFVYYYLLTAVDYMVLRYFINMTQGTQRVTKFMSRHMRKLFIPSMKCVMKLILFKMMLSVPLGIGIYGIVHFYRRGMTGNISMIGLMMLMLSIGFSLVWLGLLLHYFVSLSLVKYIIELNPRANFFDACDLSVKLMEGRHRRVLSFMLGLLPCFLSCVLIYPAAIVYPYVTECRTLLAMEIMGDHWQDKLPSMAKRWEKQLMRQQEV